MPIPLFIIDIEASGLKPASYPIEIGWAHRYDPNQSGGFLIRPEREWTYWDKYAEDYIHKISRFECEQYGVDAVSAANRLNEKLNGELVLSDAVEYDRPWIRKLFNAAGMEINFKVVSIYDYIDPAKVEKFNQRIMVSGVQHRALADAKGLVECLNYFSP